MDTRAAPIVVFTIYGCPYCRNTIKFLKSSNVKFKAFNIGNNATAMMKLAEATGWRTVPKVFVQGNFIGGYNELMEMVDNGELSRLLSQPMS